jgi:hypothetical protein
VHPAVYSIVDAVGWPAHSALLYVHCALYAPAGEGRGERIGPGVEDCEAAGMEDWEEPGTVEDDACGWEEGTPLEPGK